MISVPLHSSSRVTNAKKKRAQTETHASKQRERAESAHHGRVSAALAQRAEEQSDFVFYRNDKNEEFFLKEAKNSPSLCF